MDSPYIFQIKYEENMNEMEFCARPRYFWDVTLVCRMATTTVETLKYRFSLVIDSSDIIPILVSNVESNCETE